ncbi:poly(A) RNA polymerase GLD2 [Periophthalmus magnuspinnatus]|uniref:poly(A) RNA polymerase GLD2 n=1 Tax=Periophthalmus magnuspinnatus TaxID=409849 RepID=UPI00145A0BCC|nr:poly(A) RNA polymerase GLD2 [Periophthalmus magnuspinnatus]XP_055080410.1 poly(A) RNA polymerase GLD2 [Periophthalmus magnuspinnatus]XP_055080411.1 poly(A) RNA polymerase GLD2 [Periophthalmus magnuspinnatus]
MFPRGGPSGHRGFYKGSFTRPPTSSGFHFNRQIRQTHINNYDGPQSLPAYQWKPTSNPVYTVGPPGANSRKRQYSAGSPNQYAKRQRVESFHSDEISPSFESPSLPQTPCPPHQAISGTSHDTMPNVSDYSSPPAHTPSSPETPDSLQPYTNDKVSAQIVELFEACRQQSSDLYRKETCRAQLQKDIKTLYPDARLYLTGSTMSGLGCRSSDADLCLVVGLKKTKDRGISVLYTLLRLLRTLAYVDRVLLIRAKVPILRFKEKGSNLEFDLNVNNTVGIRNTFLLRSYTHADIRIQPLMLVIKKWARTCEINDASKGTLSSYALALMALNYLQILKPCVLPSLQRDHPACFDPSLDLDMVPDASHRVPHYKSKNKSSLGDLFLGFLKYYAYKFRWDSKVISVRDAITFAKVSPDWRGKFICVEEPFEMHNVARAVHEKAKFDAIKARFDESYQILNEARDLSLLLPLRAIIHKEQIGR